MYTCLVHLLKATEGLSGEVELIVSEVVAVEKEVRCFIKDNRLLDAAFYEATGPIQDPKEFAEAFLRENDVDLSISYVLDLGFNNQLGWFIIELNAAWGAGLNECCTEKAIEAIEIATVSTNG